jgi:aspartyl-tRNA(Asn)/glutamyl-tRNA(Gln) amidotransferase subunit A
VWTQVADLLHDSGKCDVKTISMPHTALSIICYHVLGECDVTSNMARYCDTFVKPELN